MTKKHSGLSKVKNIYHHRIQTVRDFQEKGKKVFGYPCAYIPTEMLTALDIVPYRLYGDSKETVNEVDRALPASFCSIMRNCLDCVLKGQTNFLDGVVVIHSCDPQEKVSRAWGPYTNYSYFHFIDMPINTGQESQVYFQGQLKDFKKTLEKFAGKTISRKKLQSAIELHNRQRSLMRELYNLTKSNLPLVSGTEILEITKALMSLPVVEGNELLTEVINEVKERKPKLKKKRARLLLWTSTLDDIDMMQMIEEQANVVIDDNCAGMRPFRGSIKRTGDPLDGIAAYYLKAITCARTFRQTDSGELKKDYQKDVEERFGFLLKQAKDWNVDGAILLLVRYCDPFAYEMMDLKDYLESKGIPVAYIEYDNTPGALAPIKTRVEAFIEIIQK